MTQEDTMEGVEMMDTKALLAGEDEAFNRAHITNENGLLPCPYCGSQNVWIYIKDDRKDYLILTLEGITCYGKCEDCTVQSGNHPDRSVAVEIWNSRNQINKPPDESPQES